MTAHRRSQRKTMTAAEVADVFGVDRSTVTRKVQETGHFAGVPAIRLGIRRVLFSRAAIDDALAAHGYREEQPA